MLEGLRAAATGMTAQQKRMDALSNDIANVNTTGYKHERTSFRDLVASQAGPGGAAGVRAGAGAAAESIGRGWAQGALQTTGRPLDVAIQGAGFLQVRLPDGRTALTRDGALQIDARGRVATSDGALVQPPVTVPQGMSSDELTIASDGTLLAQGRPLGRLPLAAVASPHALDDAGNGRYLTNAGSGAARAAGRDTTIAQGALEMSNVDLGDAMVDLMAAQRGFQMASQAVRTQDQMLSIANGIKQ
ncbi:MAG TPA: flagellar hook-basal body protein [Solirubrobacteraceae bacterium]|nr:flagellar hook-basal body protein [Solirubrobacteraceae bacterium]